MTNFIYCRLGIQQRVLPAYRAAFFDMLAQVCQSGLSVFAGRPRSDEAINTTDRLEVARTFAARNIQPMSASSPYYVGWQVGLIPWLAGWQPDILIVEANPRLLSTRLAVGWMHQHRRPVIGWGLGTPPINGQRFVAAFLRQDRARFLRSLDGLIAYSQRGAEEYRALGFSAEHVAVALNAVASGPTALPPPRLREEGGSPVLLFVGRLQARKRIDHLLRACASLPPERQPRLWIVGDGPAMAELKALASQIYPRTEFFGARHGPDLEPFFAADLFVLPGTGGLAVQQAMAHGLPVIVAEGDGTQGDLVRPSNGWLIPPDNLTALTDALREALSDASRLREMGLESHRIVSQDVNLERMVEAFVGVINRIQSEVRP